MNGTGSEVREDRAPRVSAIVTCFNEELNIRRCIESLLWCDEILVVDSHSTDRTPEIVREFEGVRLLQREYYGAASQKNWALERVRYDWVLILDADEVVTSELRDEIARVLARPAADAYTLFRQVFFLGKPIRFCGFRNDSVVRLFRRGTGYYERRRVHARLVTEGPAPRLRHRLTHYMVQEFDEYIGRIRKYALWGAADGWRAGTRSGPLQVVVRPAWRFLRMYVLQLGFLDGLYGFVFCAMQSYASFLKWTALWAWWVNDRRGITPKLPAFDDESRSWEGLQRIESAACSQARDSIR